MGIGDHLVCNGLVRELLVKDSPYIAYLVCKRKYAHNVHAMFADDKRIVPLLVSTDSPVEIDKQVNLFRDHFVYGCERYYRIGFEKCRRDWDVSFYDCVGMPFETRWKSFQINRDREQERSLYHLLNPKDEPFILVHASSSEREYQLDIQTNLKKIVVSPVRDNGKIYPISAWCSLIESASEVHCIDSSFIHLAQSIGVQRGIFHNIRTADTMFSLHPSWETKEYRRNVND